MSSTADAVSSADSGASLSRIQALLAANTELLKMYALILQRASALRTFRVEQSSPDQVEAYRRSADPYHRIWGPANIAGMNWFSAGYIVRLFTVSHVKSKLNELSLAYLTLLAATPLESHSPDADGSLDPTRLATDRLVRAQKLCADLAKELPSGHGPVAIFSTIWPIATGLFLAGAGFDDLYKAVFELNLKSVVSVLIALLVPALYAILAASNSFLYKRELFLPGAWFLERGSRYQMEPPVLGTNAYAAEDQLFELLERRKRRELPLDVVITFFGVLIIVGAAVSVTILLIRGSGPINLLGFEATWLALFAAYAAFVYVLMSLSDFLVPFRRQWR